MYLSQTSESLGDYLEAYEPYWQDLSDNAEELFEYEDRTLFSTWNLSLDRVRARDPDAAELMHFLAYFGAQRINFELFQPAALAQTFPWLSMLTENKRRFQRAMALLQEYSLVEASANGYSLHNCVHDWTLQTLNREPSEGHFWMAVHCIASRVQHHLHRTAWKVNRSLVEHAVRLEHNRFSNFLEAKNLDDWRLSNLHSLGILFLRQDDYSRAETLYKKVLIQKEKNLGRDNLSVLQVVTGLADLYCYQGKYECAEQMYQRVLIGREKALGPSHNLVLKTCASLGTVSCAQGRTEDAERFLSRVLEGQKSLPPDDILSTYTIYGLGLVYMHQGDMAKAEIYSQTALTGFETAFGRDSQRTLATVQNLGELYLIQERIAEAEKMYERVLTDGRGVLGPNNVLILNAAFGLAKVYTWQNRSEQLWPEAIMGFKSGTRDLSRLRAIYELGRLYHDQNMVAKVEQIYQQLLEGYQKKFGSDHRCTKSTAFYLATLYRNEGKTPEAELIESNYDWSDLSLTE